LCCVLISYLVVGTKGTAPHRKGTFTSPSRPAICNTHLQHGAPRGRESMWLSGKSSSHKSNHVIPGPGALGPWTLGPLN
jgi:hypothetical protein